GREMTADRADPDARGAGDVVELGLLSGFRERGLRCHQDLFAIADCIRPLRSLGRKRSHDSDYTPPSLMVTPLVASESKLYARRWWALAVLCLSLLIVFVGNSSLNVAIPTLSRDLHATESQLQWVVAIYSLVFAGLLFTTGALGDRYGRKGMLQVGLFVFAAAALFASQAAQLRIHIARTRAAG